MSAAALRHEASVRRRSRFQDGSGDLICYRGVWGVCQKWRVALAGGGVLSPEGEPPTAGLKLGYARVLGPRLERGKVLISLKDPPRSKWPGWRRR